MRKKIDKVLLIAPPNTIHKNEVRRCVPPIGLAYLAAYLEHHGNYEVKIIDSSAAGYDHVKYHDEFVTYGLSSDEIEKKINDFGPDVVGVSTLFSLQANNVKDVFRLVKSIDKKIITLNGGSHPTYSIDDTLANKDIDYIILYEGELPTLELLNTLKANGDTTRIKGIAYRGARKSIVNKEAQYIDNIDTLPFPARHLLNLEMYFGINRPQNPYAKGKRVAQVYTSRGCTGKCVFCTSTNFWGNRYRCRSEKNVIEEMKMLKDRYEIDEVQFTDDNLTLNKKRAMGILNELKKLNLSWCLPQGIAVWALDADLLDAMANSGCYQLTFAIESGNQDVLSKIVKKPLKLNKVKRLVDIAKSRNISLHAFAICGFPGETIEQMYETYNFIRECEFDSASFFVATPLVGSELLKICKERNYIPKDFDYRKQFFKTASITTNEFNADDVKILVEEFNREYNKNDNRKKYIEMHLSS